MKRTSQPEQKKSTLNHLKAESCRIIRVMLLLFITGIPALAQQSAAEAVSPGSHYNLEEEAYFVDFPIVLDKTAVAINGEANLLTYSQLGDVITYMITIENVSNSNINQNSLELVDYMATTGPAYVSGNENGNPNLEPGEVWTYVATYVVKAEDLERGWVTNTAKASLKIGNRMYCISDDETVISTRFPFIGFSKTGNFNDTNGDRKYSAGDQITYSFSITNLGNIPLNNVAVTDPQAVVSGGPIPVLAAGTADKSTFTAVYTLTGDDVDAGWFTNVATVSGNAGGVPFSVTDDDTQYFDRVSLIVDKTAVSVNSDPEQLTFSQTGDVVTYTITVENSGLRRINRNRLTINDARASTGPDFVSGSLNNNPVLEPGEVWTYTATSIVTEEDIEQGWLTNTVIASVKVGNRIYCIGDNETVFLTMMPELTIDKQADKQFYSVAGEVVTYIITIENTGNVTLLNIAATDPVTGLNEIIPVLEPGAKVTYTEAYTITQADLDKGSVVNTAAASYIYMGSGYKEEAVETVNAVSNPRLAISKQADRQVYSAVGEVITYTIEVKNTGNVTLSNIEVTDPATGLDVIIASLAPGSIMTYQEIYIVTPDDISQGNIVNTVVAVYDHKGLEYSESAVNVVTYALLPSLTLTKSADPPVYRNAGDVIAYTIVAANTGMATLSNIKVTDPKTGLDTTVESLAPGASVTFNEEYVITRMDYNYGNVSNTVSAVYQYHGKEYQESASAVVVSEALPGLTMTKTASVLNYSWAGQEITYSILVINTSNITLTGVEISDPATGLTATIPSMAPGAVHRFSTSYTVTIADLDKSELLNTVIAVFRYGGSVYEETASATVFFEPNPNISVTKTASEESFSFAGQEIRYTIRVANSGNVPLSNITVSDPLTGLSETIASLPPGSSQTFNASYVVTQSDLDRGMLVNTATATDGTNSGMDTEIVHADQKPELNIIKASEESDYDAVGEVISYNLEVVNSGNVTLSNVLVSDPLTGFSAVIATLAPQAVHNFTTGYTVKQADLDIGYIVNRGSANSGEIIAVDIDTVYATRNPALKVDKSADVNSFIAAGETINYTISVTNTGNVTLHEVRVTDHLAGLSEKIQTLTPGATEIFVASYITRQSDLNNGSVINVVVASDGKISASDTETVTSVKMPELTLTKAADVSSYSAAGDLISYSLVVTNSGNTTLRDIIITDPLTNLSQIVFFMVPGATRTIKTNYTVSQSDIDNGSVFNTVNAKYSFEGVDYSISDTAEVMAGYNPEISLEKQSSRDTYSRTGEKIIYSVLVSNTGNATLSDIVVTDPLTGFSTLINRLTPGSSRSFVTIYTIMQSDLDRGYLNNTATAIYSFDGEDYTETDTLTLLADAHPSLFVTKRASLEEYTTAGEIVSWTIEVINRGNVSLSNLMISDPLTGFSQAIESLAPGSARTFTTSYAITQSDIDHGTLLNTVTVLYEFNGAEYEESGSETVRAVFKPALILAKRAGQPYYSYAGEEIPYRISVENTGNVTLGNIIIADPLTGFRDSIASIPPGALQSFTTSYSILQADMDAGKVVNVSSASFVFDGKEIIVHDTATVVIQAMPGLTLDKTADKQEFSLPGEQITYTLAVTNTGNVVLTNILVTDPLTGFSVVLARLEPGAIQNYTESYIITQEDVASGKVVNVASVAAVFSDNDVAAIDTVTVMQLLLPDVKITKVADKEQYSQPGEKITYTIIVENTGNVVLTQVLVVDALVRINNTVPSLAPGSSVTYTGTYTVSQSDIDTGTIINTATATGNAAGGRIVESETAIEVKGLYLPSLEVYKESGLISTEAGLGEVIPYMVRITNTGNVTLRDIRVRDPLTGLDVTVALLLPGSYEDFLTDYTVTMADETLGRIVNTASAEATAPRGDKIFGEDTVTVNVLFCELVIPNGFSPNNDGIQDTWRIKCIEKYPNARIDIFNRWGNLVFEKENYGNIDLHGSADAWWDGHSTHKWTLGKDILPAGTYFYILDLKDGNRPRNGFLYLNR